MTDQEIKSKAIFLNNMYITFLTEGIAIEPKKFLKEQKIEKEVRIYVMPFLINTQKWYEECKELYQK